MKYRGKLDAGEHVITCNRPHPLKLLKPALVLLAAIFLANMTQVITGAHPGWSAVAPIILIAALIYAIARLLKWATTGYALTSRRIVVLRGWGGRGAVTIPLETVAGVVGPRGKGKLTGCGTIRISAMGQTYELTCQKDPGQFSELCHEAHVRCVQSLRWQGQTY
ncbi:hypothetical protein D8M21_07225 [Kocuria sp. HSID16901]|nr:hypothetical protein D8M21_07225 [Kocuria sp. HSID16901]